MNVWTAIKAKLERETGYQVVSLPGKDDTIQTNQIILMITSITRTSYEDVYEVRGELAVKHSHMCNWRAVTDLLDLELTGAQAEAVLTTYAGGFTAMSVAFMAHAKKDKNRQFAVEVIKYEAGS